MSTDTRRKRGPNFQQSEISQLFDCVSQFIEIIENKKTDKVNNADKASAWDKILTTFNARTTGVSRYLTELKNAWNNKKGQTRKNAAKEKRDIFSTGGGVADLPTTDKIEESIRVLLGPSVDGHQNIYDSDATWAQVACSPIVDCQPADDNTVTKGPPILIEMESPANDNIIVLSESSLGEERAPQLPAETPVKFSIPELPAKAPTWVRWNPASLKSPVSEVLQIAAKGDTKADNKGSTSAGKLAIPGVFNTRKRRPSLNPSSIDVVNKAKHDYLEVQRQLALEQGAREAKLFDIRCEREQLEKELLELQVKKLRADMGGT